MKTNKKKGISLIVLVITIIIMIILAAAVILSLSSSDIVNKASEAKTKSDMANAKEFASTAYAEWMMMSETKKKDQYNDNFSEYVVDKLEDAGLPTSAEAYSDLIGMKIGDKVDYTPGVETTISAKYREYDENSWSETNYFIRQTNLEWKYAGTDDNGNVILLSEMPTTQKMYLEGATGYLEGPTKLNELCKELYSNSTYGDARSINVEDVNRILGANPKPYYYDEEGKIVSLLSPITIGEIEKKEGITLNNTETPEGTIANYKVDYYYYKGTDYKANITPEYKLIFKNHDNSSDITYWIASPCVGVDFLGGSVGDYTSFYVRVVSGGYLNASVLLYSDIGGPQYNYCGVRPVVTLKSNIKIGNKNLDGEWTLS